MWYHGQGLLQSAGLMAINLVWFLWVARSYEYKEIEHPRRAHPAQQKPSGQAEPLWMQPQNGHSMQAAHVSGCCCVCAAQTGMGLHPLSS